MDPQSAATATATVPQGRPRARTAAAARPAPEVDEDHAHLSLPALRAYRTALQAEEGKVSYWRRILQARLDVLRAGGTGGLDPRLLAPVLTDVRVGAGRTALVEVLPLDDIPPLPRLSQLWERRVAPDDIEGQRTLELDLIDAEGQLSSYRAVLHRRLAAATGELIARYRQQPGLCLSALPLPAPRRTS